MTLFVVGFALAAVVFWNVSTAVERFRRSRRDFHATRRGLRTLVEMMVANAVSAVKMCFWAVVAVGAVFVVWRSRDFR